MVVYGITNSMDVSLSKLWELVSVCWTMVASLAFHVVTATWVETLGKKCLVVQWLGLLCFYCGGMGSIPGRGTKIPQASLPPAP